MQTPLFQWGTLTPLCGLSHMAMRISVQVAPKRERRRRSRELAIERTEARRGVKIASIRPEAKGGIDPVLDLSNTGPDFPWWAFI
jgi:hypothetical protein